MDHRRSSAGVDPFKEGTHHTWTDEQIDAFEKEMAAGLEGANRPRLVHLDRPAFSGRALNDLGATSMPTGITGSFKGRPKAKLLIPVHGIAGRPSTLGRRRMLSSCRPLNSAKPFTEKGYGQWMAKAIERAGLPAECVAHGLRKATARRLAETGSTEKEIRRDHRPQDAQGGGALHRYG